MYKEEKCLLAISTFENTYIEHTKGSKSHEILRNNIKNYINSLQQENKQLKERIEYLERSNNRREDEIIYLRQELVDKGEE